jgi:hypothetical protein
VQQLPEPHKDVEGLRDARDARRLRERRGEVDDEAQRKVRVWGERGRGSVRARTLDTRRPPQPPPRAERAGASLPSVSHASAMLTTW